jgi:hypothetical protein
VQWPEKGRPKEDWLGGMIKRGTFKKSELQKLKAEENLPSDTDLTDIRKEWIKNQKAADPNAPLSEKDQEFEKANRLRNHGLYSKAERALTIAGWSDQARRDVEVFRLVDTEGLTPLLMVLNESPKASGAAEKPSTKAG